MIGLETWLMFALGLSLLLHFINVVLWRDDIALRDSYSDDLEWERLWHDETLTLLEGVETQLNAVIDSHTEAEMELAFALEQLYAKASLQEVMDSGTLVIVSDVDLQALSVDKGEDGSFSFDQLVTASLDEEDDGLVPND